MSEVGAHRKRIEDPRLLRGQGQYVEDLHIAGTLDVAFVRSATSVEMPLTSERIWRAINFEQGVA